MVISFLEKWHNCRVLLFGTSSYHRSENVTIPPSCPTESSLGLKSFQKAICHPLSQAADQTRRPALVSTPSRRYQGPVFLFISPSIIIRAKEGNILVATQLGDTLSHSRSLVREKGAGFSFLMVNGASVCSQHHAPASPALLVMAWPRYPGPHGRIRCWWLLEWRHPSISTQGWGEGWSHVLVRNSEALPASPQFTPSSEFGHEY